MVHLKDTNWISRLWFALLSATDRRLLSLLLLLAIGASAHILWMHWQIINFPYPLEYRENTDLWRAILIYQGNNLYAYENYPSANSQYGIVFPGLASLLFHFTGPGFFPLRLVAWLAVLPMLALFWVCGRREGVSPASLYLSVVIVYALQLLLPGNFLGMPNTLGMTLFAFAVLLPAISGFSRGSLILTVVLSAIGAFTKLYFCFGVFYVGAYLLYTRRWREMLFLSVCSLIVLSVVVALVAFWAPGFLESNVRQNAAVVTWIPKFIWLQFRDFVRVLFAFVLVIILVRAFAEKKPALGLSDPYVFGLVFFGLLLLRMAANDGQYLLYLQHLLLPFLAGLFYRQAASMSWSLWVHLLLLWNLGHLYVLDFRRFDLESARQSFVQLDREIHKLGDPGKILFNLPLSYFAIVQGITPHDHGQVAGLHWTQGEGHRRFEARNAEVRASIAKRKYSAIFTDDWYSPLVSNFDQVASCYVPVQTYTLRMYEQKVPVTLWVPGQPWAGCPYVYVEAGRE